MKMKATSKRLAFVLVALVLVALMPMAVRPAAAANPDTTDWIPDQMASTDLVRDEGRPSIATGKYNRLYVAYEHRNPTTNKWEIKVARSTDGGTRWSVIHTKSLSGYNLYRPSIAVDPYYDYIYVAYERQYSSTNWDILLDRYVGGVWYTEYVDNDIDDNDRLGTIAVDYHYDTSNYVYIVYEEHVTSTDYDLWFKRSTDHGDTWVNPLGTDVKLRDTTILAHGPSIAVGHGGYVALAYRHGSSTLGHIDVMRSWNRGSTWTHEFNISGLTNDSSDPSIIKTRDFAEVIVAFTYEYSTTNDDIYYTYSWDYGDTWQTSTPIAASTANERYPHLTVDGMGRTDNYAGYMHVTYLKQETVGSRTNGVYHRKANIATPWSWSTARQIADDNAKVQMSYWPKLVDRAITTVRDTVPVVVWTDYRGGDHDVYATTLGGKFTIDTSPSGLRVRVDGTYYTAPVSFYWAWGSSHHLYVRSTQGTHSFVRWSDGGARSHYITAYTYTEELIVAYYTPTLTLSLSPTTVARGSPLTISGKLTPGLATTISLYYRMSGTYTWALGTTIPTDSTGAYSLTATIPMSAPTGTLDLVAAWYDSTNNRYAVSEIQQLTITP